MEKGEYRRMAAELGIAVVCPDTSPRGDNVPDEADNWQFGSELAFISMPRQPLCQILPDVFVYSGRTVGTGGGKFCY